VANKQARKKREGLLTNRVYSNNFVLVYDFIDKNYGVFFGISSKSANPIKRNRIKRVFRNLIKENLNKVDLKKNELSLSICLISKKGIKLTSKMDDIKEELQGLVQKLNKRIQ
jgi:ribonuclease P protein component